MTNDIVLDILQNREHPLVSSILARELVQMDFETLGRKYYKLERDACVLAFQRAVERTSQDVRLNRVDVVGTNLYQHVLWVGKQEMWHMKYEQIQRQKGI